MIPRRRGIRGAVAGPLSALMLTLSVAIPFLERSDIRHETAVESHHDPSACPTAHDHTVCTQVGANHGAPSPGSLHRAAHVSYRSPVPAPPPGARTPALIAGPPSRAPPSTTAH